jgi:pyruvate-formate lyase
MSQTSIDESLEFLAHYGIKGMHWGVRRNGGHPGREEHPVSSDAQKAHEVARTIHEHGTAAVGNEDLQHLVNRQRLLQQHAQLNPGDPSHYRKGLDYVKSLTNDVNTVVNAVNTGQRAVKTAQGFSSERPAHRQGRRTRNKPLKVVDIRAA